jgi:hypothetical protein
MRDPPPPGTDPDAREAGRNPRGPHRRLLVDMMPSRLTKKQRELLRLTIEAGSCVCMTPSVSYAAWTVRTGPGGGIEREFSEATGDRLLRLGMIELVPGETPQCPGASGSLRVAPLRTYNEGFRAIGGAIMTADPPKGAFYEYVRVGCGEGTGVC